VTQPKHPVALCGIVGSNAYGLARAGSDVDRLGISVAPTRALLGLAKLDETIHSAGPNQDTDVTYHEVGKYIRLAAVCNPTVLELLFLPGELIEVCTPDGALLRENREAFLSETYVRAAYGGYALAQARKLQARGDGSFSSDTRKRTAKHARHCFRLLRQGAQLLANGDMTLRVDNPDEYFAFDDMPVEKILTRFAEEDARFRATASVLPQRADLAAVERMLLTIRDRHYELPV
jgi:predicted nucleotidyltransferase